MKICCVLMGEFSKSGLKALPRLSNLPTINELEHRQQLCCWAPQQLIQQIPPHLCWPSASANLGAVLEEGVGDVAA